MATIQTIGNAADMRVSKSRNVSKSPSFQNGRMVKPTRRASWSVLWMRQAKSNPRLFSLAFNILDDIVLVGMALRFKYKTEKLRSLERQRLLAVLYNLIVRSGRIAGAVTVLATKEETLGWKP